MMEDKNQNATNYSEPTSVVDREKERSAGMAKDTAMATAAVKLTEAAESAKRLTRSDPE
jgi:hypothetical protein